MAPRVALLTPFAHPSVRGNAITVERIARGLRSRGMELGVWDVSRMPAGLIEQEILAFAPALVHAFHAYRVGPLALRLARTAGLPLLLTITGTDANHDLFDPERADVVRETLEAAAGITVFHRSMASRIIEALPGMADRLHVVPQSASFDDEEPGQGAAHWLAVAPPPPSGPSLLFPAGIRMVKAPLFPLAPVDALALRHPGLELRYVGPILDPAEGEALLAAIRGRPWARFLGAVPHQRMRGLLEAADVVLNCSISEGGMANSVLEAMALGRAVLASDIAGNRSLVEDGVTGLLFAGPETFARKLDLLLGDRELRRRLGETARARVRERFGPERELGGYLALYGKLCGVLRGA
ncbi:MAG: glycosyltransferase family 4 protein [Candidatus Rokubacteria bacterium]|nr:glycosyltransferase family 4 protein [Candidatus Rokubacteria bacterium]